MADEEEAELSEKQKIDIAKWFLLNSPPGEIQFVAKGIVEFNIQRRRLPHLTSAWLFPPESQFLISYILVKKFRFLIDRVNHILCFVFNFGGRCEGGSQRRRFVRRGSLRGIPTVQQIPHDFTGNARRNWWRMLIRNSLLLWIETSISMIFEAPILSNLQNLFDFLYIYILCWIHCIIYSSLFVWAGSSYIFRRARGDWVPWSQDCSSCCSWPHQTGKSCTFPSIINGTNKLVKMRGVSLI